LRIAHVVRAPAARLPPAPTRIEIELEDVEARITVDARIDRDVLAMIIAVVSGRGRRSS
jgi:hypothetical protein